jgi:hypothetical protein
MIYELKSNSKNILAGKYNSETKMLKITFSGTGTYKYPNVELEEIIRSSRIDWESGSCIHQRKRL